MIETAWDEYRGWAKRSHSLQAAIWSWNIAALCLAVLAAVFGAIAAETPNDSPEARILAGLAALAAAVTPLIGRHILDVGGEAAWIRARATAEAIKSQCFLFAASVGPYAKGNAQDTFIKRRADLTDIAAKEGLTPQPDPVGVDGDKRRPPMPMSEDWYVANRLRDQKKNFYEKRGADYERQIGWLRWAGFICAMAGTVFGAAASAFKLPGMTPWIGVATTLGAMVVAYGLMERRKYLAASYSAMATALGRLEEGRASRDRDEPLVEEAEALMDGEHAAWVVRMTKTIAAPAPAAPAPSAQPKP
jgi:hypothetical protein